jgi:DNA repair protein RadC
MTKNEHPGGRFRRDGPNSLSDAQLLSIVIGSGTKGNSAEEIATRLISQFGSIDRIPGAKISDLMKIEGIGPRKATQIAAIFEITRRIIRQLDGE